jgi:hypothetical protein
VGTEHSFKPSYTTNTFYFPPHHFSIHLYRLRHPAEGSSRFLQNRSTLHGAGVQKMTSNLKSTVIIAIKYIFWTSFTVKNPILLRHDAWSLHQWFPTFWRKCVGSVEMPHRLGCGVIWARFTALIFYSNHWPVRGSTTTLKIKCQSFGVWCCVNWCKPPCVLKRHNAAIFGAQQSIKNNGVERYSVGAQVG